MHERRSLTNMLEIALSDYCDRNSIEPGLEHEKPTARGRR
ncbi:hypothetical protein SAMN05446935_1458 [Burkholderia sp. YR290]|nr:hypothetical protein SAMN05446935_1458 [Burkholderia sp. YR290]